MPEGLFAPRDEAAQGPQVMPGEAFTAPFRSGLGPILLRSALKQRLLQDPIITSNGLATLVHIHLQHQEQKQQELLYEAYLWKQIICK